MGAQAHVRGACVGCLEGGEFCDAAADADDDDPLAPALAWCARYTSPRLCSQAPCITRMSEYVFWTVDFKLCEAHGVLTPSAAMNLVQMACTKNLFRSSTCLSAEPWRARGRQK